jgi:hypothetical protein
MFDIMHLGPILWLLGLAVTQNCSKQTLSIFQEAYIDPVVCWFNLEDAKPLWTPINSNSHLLKDDCPISVEDKQEMKKVPYYETG